MTPKPEPEEFSELKKLLALKRHEAPPPGYFQNFSSKVIARIEAESAPAARPWWARWLAEFDLRPAVASAYALVVGGFLVVGLGVALDRPPEVAGELQMPPLAQPLLAAQAPAPSPAAAQPQLTLQPVPLPDNGSSAVGAVLNPDAAPSGFFRVDGFMGRAVNVSDKSPVGLQFRRSFSE
jgi:hypothetical protein